MNSSSSPIQKLRSKRISLPATILTVIVLLFIVFWQFSLLKAADKKSHRLGRQTKSCPPPAIVQYRMSDYRFTKPLLLSDVLADQGDDDGRMGTISEGINRIIADQKSAGVITHASVYLREYATNKFISVGDENETYHPASLLKVPLLMSVLRKSEVTPGFLDREISVNDLPKEAAGIKRKQDFLGGKSLEAGKKYTMRDLLSYMIVESDNSAALLLERSRDEKMYNSLFNSLGLTSPYEGLNQGVFYTISAAEYSRFMRLLYNATYLSNENADYALSLLTKSEFKEGILKALPAGITAAHKFGEYGWEENGKAIRDYELHESAIIYLNDNPILVTIMTKGKNKMDLAPVIAEITKYIYEQETKPAI